MKISRYASATAFRRALEDRLQQWSGAEILDIQRLRRQVAFDRLLARLFHDENPPWLLKGGYAMELRLKFARTTRDIDPSAPSERVGGWAEILQRLGDVEAGVAPRLFIHRRCGRLLETLPALQHDPNRPEDVLKVDADEDGAGGDDCADALRYLVATKPRVVVQRKLRGL